MLAGGPTSLHLPVVLVQETPDVWIDTSKNLAQGRIRIRSNSHVNSLRRKSRPGYCTNVRRSRRHDRYGAEVQRWAAFLDPVFRSVNPQHRISIMSTRLTAFTRVRPPQYRSAAAPQTRNVRSASVTMAKPKPVPTRRCSETGPRIQWNGWSLAPGAAFTNFATSLRLARYVLVAEAQPRVCSAMVHSAVKSA